MQAPAYKHRYDPDTAKAPWQNVWSNVVFCWAPFLGKQGQRLEDISGYNRYGNLTNEHTNNWDMVGYPGYTFDIAHNGTNVTTVAANYNNLDLTQNCTIEIMWNYGRHLMNAE